MEWGRKPLKKACGNSAIVPFPSPPLFSSPSPNDVTIQNLTIIDLLQTQPC